MVGYYAQDYLNPSDVRGARKDSEAEDVESAPPRCTNPALQTAYDEQTGVAFPARYEDHAPHGSAPDMRNVAGAPQMWEKLNAKQAGTDFFDASSFVPRNTQADVVEDIMTGHDKEQPGLLPWKVYRNAAVLLALAWFLAAAYQILYALDVATFADFTTPPTIGRHSKVREVTKIPKVVPSPSFVQLMQSSVTGVHHGPAAEKLAMSLPISNMEARGLSCDADAKHFALTDGLSTFVAELKGSLDFQDVTPCAALLGEVLDDTAVACGVNKDGCEVLVLHRSGNRVAACPIAKESSKAEGGAGQMAAVSQHWLQNDHATEEVAWLMADSSCDGGGSLACTSVGTTHGRIAHLQHSNGNLSPESVLHDGQSHASSKIHGLEGSWQPGMVRAFNSRYLGILQPHRNSIQVVDATHDMAEAGTLTLPVNMPVGAFCVGGGYVYFLSDSDGPSAHMWRLPVPTGLAV